jgi:hypothetical protein
MLAEPSDERIHLTAKCVLITRGESEVKRTRIISTTCGTVDFIYDDKDWFRTANG